MNAAAPRRALLVALLSALSGCGAWLGTVKKPIPGKRYAVLPATGALRLEAALAGPIHLPPPRSDFSWPQPGGKPDHVGGQLTLPAQLSMRWRADIGQGTTYRQRITAEPVVLDGQVFTFDAAGRVRAFALDSGRFLWGVSTRPKSHLGSNVGGGVSTAGGMVYAGTGFGEMVALEAASGKIAWRTPLDAPACSAPAIADEQLFVATNDDQLHAIDAKTGHELWRYQAETSQTGILGTGVPAVFEDIIVAGFGSGALAALRVADGSAVWTDSLASGAPGQSSFASVVGRPVIDGESVYAVGGGGLMLSLDLPTGRRLWTRSVASVDSPWAAGGTLFVITTSQQLVAFAGDSSAVRWVADLPAWHNPKEQVGALQWMGPVLAGGQLFAAGTDARLAAIDPQTGRMLGEMRLAGKPAVAPVVVADLLLQIIDDGTLIAYG